jgi:hypothetical protein
MAAPVSQGPLGIPTEGILAGDGDAAGMGMQNAVARVCGSTGDKGQRRKEPL